MPFSEVDMRERMTTMTETYAYRLASLFFGGARTEEDKKLIEAAARYIIAHEKKIAAWGARQRMPQGA